MAERLSEPAIVDFRDEPVVWAGNVLPHYGHFMLESVARLWPLLPGAELEGLPVVFAGSFDEPVFIDEWQDAFGAQRIGLPPKGAIRFRRMYVPEPAWQLDCWGAPEIRDIHLQARRNLRVPSFTPCDVLWLSRSMLTRRRAPYDERLLEWALEGRARIVHPEIMTFGEQLAVIESTTAVAGVIGSAFHTLLMAREPPECIYMCPDAALTHGAGGRFQASYPTQDELLGAVGRYYTACERLTRRHRYPATDPVYFPAGFRLLVPEILRVISNHACPGLLDDRRAAALAYPGKWIAVSALERAAAEVLRKPASVEARLALAGRFEQEGFERCALEQLMTVVDIADDPLLGLRRAARIYARLGDAEQAAAIQRDVRRLGGS